MRIALRLLILSVLLQLLHPFIHIKVDNWELYPVPLPRLTSSTLPFLARPSSSGFNFLFIFNAYLRPAFAHRQRGRFSSGLVSLWQRAFWSSARARFLRHTKLPQNPQFRCCKIQDDSSMLARHG
ncbi:hypothetical protein EV426DRAFT_602105 [Tirmania nivea]|nr:hypothetical protein EV426DRAFT_602105 [Tirmania nivea]